MTVASFRTMLRTFTPLGWGLVGTVVVVVALAVLSGAGVRWDPFGLDARRLERARQAATVAEVGASARAAEIAAERVQQDRLIVHFQTARAVDVATALASADARTADDADTPLDPDRIARLHAHDRELCRLAPDLDGCAATAGPS